MKGYTGASATFRRFERLFVIIGRLYRITRRFGLLFGVLACYLTSLPSRTPLSSVLPSTQGWREL